MFFIPPKYYLESTPNSFGVCLNCCRKYSLMRITISGLYYTMHPNCLADVDSMCAILFSYLNISITIWTSISPDCRWCMYLKRQKNILLRRKTDFQFNITYFNVDEINDSSSVCIA